MHAQQKHVIESQKRNFNNFGAHFSVWEVWLCFLCKSCFKSVHAHKWAYLEEGYHGVGARVEAEGEET